MACGNGFSSTYRYNRKFAIVAPVKAFMSFYVDYKKLLTSCELPEQSENLPRMTTNPHSMHYYLGVMVYLNKSC
jgi:hypothetical protein